MQLPHPPEALAVARFAITATIARLGSRQLRQPSRPGARVLDRLRRVRSELAAIERVVCRG